MAVNRPESEGVVRGQGQSTATNPWQPCYNYYISNPIGPQSGARTESSIVTVTVNKPVKKQSKRRWWLALFDLSEPWLSS